jgi:hypothetical protein
MSEYAFLPEQYRKAAKIVDQKIDQRFGTDLTVPKIDRRLAFLQENRDLASRKQQYFSNVVMKVLVPYSLIVIIAFYGATWLGMLDFLSSFQRSLLYLVLGLPVILGAGLPMFLWRPDVPALHALETECLLLDHYKSVRTK